MALTCLMRGGGGRRQCARGSVIGVVAALVVVLMMPAAPALAHAIVEASSPADGTLLAAAPTDLRVRFSEPISDEFVDVSFLTSSTSIDDERLVGTVDPDDPSVLVVALPALGDGLYQIGFGVRDREDLHEVRGRSSFSIGDHAMAAPSPPPAPPAQPLETGARWLFATGLALLIGVVITRSRWPDAPVAYPRRLAQLTAVALGFVVAGRIGVISARAYDLHVGMFDGLSVVARTSDMARLPVVIAAVLCAVPLLTPHRFASLDVPLMVHRSLSIRTALAWMAVIWLALMAAWGDHSALRGSVEPTMVLAKAAHLIGIGEWVGVVVVTLLVNAGSGRTASALAASSRVAIIGAMLTVASGLLLAGRMVVSLTGLFATAFGQLLVLKLIGVAIVVLIGLTHRRWHRSAPAVIEAIVLVGVVLLGASMATAGPATGDAYRPAPSSTTSGTVNGQVDDMIVRLRAVPAQPGPNDLELNVVQTRRPATAPITEVTVTAMTTVGSQSWTVVPDDRGAAVITGVNLSEGADIINVAVTRSSLPAANVQLELTTKTARYYHPVIVSSQPVRLPLQMLALAIGVLACAALISTSRRQFDQWSDARDRVRTH